MKNDVERQILLCPFNDVSDYILSLLEEIKDLNKECEELKCRLGKDELNHEIRERYNE